MRIQTAFVVMVVSGFTFGRLSLVYRLIMNLTAAARDTLIIYSSPFAMSGPSNRQDRGIRLTKEIGAARSFSTPVQAGKMV